jgi:hypothetical protein
MSTMKNIAPKKPQVPEIHILSTWRTCRQGMVTARFRQS